MLNTNGYSNSPLVESQSRSQGILFVSMPNCILLLACGIVAGAYVLQNLPSLEGVHLFFVFLCVVLGIGIAVYALKKIDQNFFYISVLLFALSLGFTRAWHQAQTRLDQSLPVLTERIQTEVTGCISSLPEFDASSARFLFDVTDKRVKGYSVSRIRISVYQNSTKIQVNSFIAGSCWILPLRVKTNRGLRNQALFDYERWLFQQGVGATAYVKGDAQALSETRYPLLKLRARIAEKITKLIGQHASRGLILGLSLGIRDELSTQAWQVLQKTGTSHLLAISGLHVGIAALFGYLIGKLIWLALSFVAYPYCTPKNCGLVMSLLFACLYAGLAGFSVPTQRACIMLLCAYYGLFLQRRFSSSVILSIALSLVVLLDPMAVISLGTWLSFLAVAILVFFATRDCEVSVEIDSFKESRRGSGMANLWAARGKHIESTIRIQFLLIGFLSIPVAIGFGMISVIAPFVNLILIPVFTLSVVPILLIAILFLPLLSDFSGLLFRLEAWWLEKIWWGLTYCSELPFSAMEYSLSFFVAILFLVLLLPCLLPRGFLPRESALLLLLPLFVGLKVESREPVLQMHIFDVGQGLSVLITTREHALLYDTGPAYRSGSSAAERVVLPHLENEDIEFLSALVLSHSDNDHAGGFNEILRNLQVDKVYAPKKDPLKDSLACEYGHTWQWDNVRFEFLYPFKETNYTNNNNLSCILRVSVNTLSGEQRILLTGDIEKEAERSLLASGISLKSDIVLAPHHGSRSSSTLAFTKAVAPQYVVYATGFANQWNFPREEVKANWQAANSEHLEINTAIVGNALFTLEKNGKWSLKTWQQYACRYWHFDCDSLPDLY